MFAPQFLLLAIRVVFSTPPDPDATKPFGFETEADGDGFDVPTTAVM